MTKNNKETQVVAYALADEPFPQPWWGGLEFKSKAADILDALKSAGFAVVELPEPYTYGYPVGFSADNYGVTVHHGRVWDGEDECEGHTPDGARAIGAMWIAAANLAEDAS